MVVGQARQPPQMKWETAIARSQELGLVKLPPQWEESDRTDRLVVMTVEPKEKKRPDTGPSPWHKIAPK